jgi:putative restriction endonuclease
MSRGELTLPFKSHERALRDLLKEFGPSAKTVHPEYPFWWLQTDGLWQVHSDRPMRSRESNSDPTITELRLSNARGQFPPDIQEKLLAHPPLISRVANLVLSSHFPDTLHGDILAAVGLQVCDGGEVVFRRRRDPNFRNAVLQAYQYRCAVCAMDLRLGAMSIGLEAAHVQWHQAHGPSEVVNGLALCNLHHKLFDLGAFTLDSASRILVSELVHGSTGFEEVLLRHHGSLATQPVRSEHRLQEVYLHWHYIQVFKKEPRPFGAP